MPKLDRQDFKQVEQTHPDRYNRLDLLGAQVFRDEPGKYIIQATDSDTSHVTQLVKAVSHPWGHCTCDGYQYNDGPCSHLCAVWRAHLKNYIELDHARVNTIQCDVVNRQQEIADHVDNRETATDGGQRTPHI